jgi:hypothetical protein
MLRTLSDRTTVAQRQHHCHASDSGIRVIVMSVVASCILHIPCSIEFWLIWLTFIFANILESESAASVLPLYNSNFAKSTLANNAQ